MFSTLRINKFKVLEEENDPTDYEYYEDIAPYNKLQDGKWTSLWMNRHPLYYKIQNRFSGTYDGKLLWSELNEMKERIETLQESLGKYQREVLPRRRKLRTLIREQEQLCGEECIQRLQKHLDKCMGFDGTGKYKCTKDYVSYDCKFKESGRCGHYYEIERAEEELAHFDYFEHEDKMKIMDLEVSYDRALAVKEDRLQEYLDDIYDEF